MLNPRGNGFFGAMRRPAIPKAFRPNNFCDATDPVRDNANNNETLQVAAIRNASTQCTARNPPLKPECPSVCLIPYFVEQEFGRDATGNHARSLTKIMCIVLLVLRIHCWSTTFRETNAETSGPNTDHTVVLYRNPTWHSQSRINRSQQSHLAFALRVGRPKCNRHISAVKDTTAATAVRSTSL
jgi:hypothetical protein